MVSTVRKPKQENIEKLKIYLKKINHGGRKN